MKEYEKKIQHLKNRLLYIQDIFAGKHANDVHILEERLAELESFIQNTSSLEDLEQVYKTTEDLFHFIEEKLEERLTPMDKVRIVRNSQRVCLRDILENVYDNFTEIGGQDEHTIDPAMIIARATLTRRSGKKVRHQQVMVIGHEKGHGEEFRNGGSAKPEGNAKAMHYMKVAEVEGIPIHTFIFTPGAYPVEEYPGAGQQIAKNLYEMAGLSVPLIAVFSEGGSGGAEAIALADKRLMLSHGYYSVISPEGAAAIEGRLKNGERATPELIESCASNLHLTAKDNLEFGYIDRIIDEPLLGARPYHFDFFRTLRQEIMRATDEVALSIRNPFSFRASGLRKVSADEINLDEIYIRWRLTARSRKRLVKARQKKFLEATKNVCIDNRSFVRSFKEQYIEKPCDLCQKLSHEYYHRTRKSLAHFVEEILAELSFLRKSAFAPFRRALSKLSKHLHIDESTNVVDKTELTKLSEWDEAENSKGTWRWVSPRAKEDKAITCPNSKTHGCLDLWAPDLFNEFAGVCTTCGHHFPMEYQWMLHNCFDEGSIREFNNEIEAANPLNFKDFSERLDAAKKKTGLNSSCITFDAKIDGINLVVATLVSPFRGGSVGAAEGNKFTEAAERAQRKRLPFLAYVHGTAGIRIQEGTHGVMQMPRCTIAVRRYIDAGGLYFVLHDHNSYAGPLASFLGCSPYQFAIRSSNIGFAGKGVIKETTGVDIAPDYHNCYKALARGHIHGVWDRRDVRANLKQSMFTMGGKNLYYR